ncbi:hypothetical protein ABZ667_21400 [Streptomyces lavendulae]
MADGYGDRVRVVTAAGPAGAAPAALLVRPDGCTAWAVDADGDRERALRGARRGPDAVVRIPRGRRILTPPPYGNRHGRRRVRHTRSGWRTRRRSPVFRSVFRIRRVSARRPAPRRPPPRRPS